MRAMSATLAAAARSSSASPYVRVRVIRKIGAAGWLDWTSLYNGGEPLKPAAIAQAGDGSIIRTRTTATYKVQIQRIASPAPDSAWGSWSTGDGTNATSVAVCARGALAWAFYAPYTGGAVYERHSTDYGATWSGWNAINAGGTSPTQIAAAIDGSNSVLVAFNRGASVSTQKWNGAAWSAETAWNNTANSITGLALCYNGDWNLIITGTEATTANPKVWSCIYGDGYSYGAGAWGPLTEIAGASAGSGVTFSFPALAMPDVYRCLFLEAYSGTTAYQRPYHTHSLPSADFASSLWREPVPFNLEPAPYGMAIAYRTGDYVYACTSTHVWRAPLVQGAGLDLTADVTSIVASAAHSSGGSATIRLDNSAAKYATPGSGDLLELQRGAMITIDPGYRTTAGAEAPDLTAPFWIESLAYQTEKARSTLIIAAADAWHLLATAKPRSQHTWASGAKNVYQIIAWVLARVGLEAGLAGQNSTIITSLQPAFTIHPGETYQTALRRLLALVPDRPIFQGTTAYLYQPLATDASAYSYGATHQILAGNYAARTLETNHVQVLGASHFSEDFNWTEIAQVYNRTAQVHDINLADVASCLARAQAQLRDQTILARADSITVPTNPAQELLDVVDVTDPPAGLAAAKRRVLATRLEYDPARAVYQQTLTLGDV